MEKKNFKKVILHLIHITFEDNNTNMGKLSLFSIMSHDQKKKLANGIYRETHLENNSIYDKEDLSNCLYVLKDGGINLQKDGKIITSFSKGEYFGALELIANSNRMFKAIRCW